MLQGAMTARVLLLGSLGIEHDGVLHDPPFGKRVALICRLARRDGWPERDEALARYRGDLLADVPSSGGRGG